MITEAKDIKSIGVIGGGTAGYFSALYLKKEFPNLDVTLIESSKIPVIGVGEASTSLLQKFLHKYMGYSVQEVFQKAKPTLKLGIKFHWGKKGNSHYNFPFGPAETIDALYHTGEYNNNSIASILMDMGKAPFLKQGNKIIPLKISKGYAYHIDNETLIAFVKTKLAESGCNFIDTEIKDVVTKNNSKEIEAVVSAEGNLHRFDLFIDCSGFRSILMGQALQSKWVDFGGSLKTNKAVIGVQNHGGKIKPYTTSTTMNHGWLWNIPTQKEDHLGYVFSKEFCSDDEALNELKKHCSDVNNEKVISFKTGRYEKGWNGNVAGIGNSFAFVEPLESTGIHMIILQLRTLKESLQKQESIAKAQEAYNKRINEAWDNIKYFIAIHFKYNEKLDTPFWEMCRKEIDVEGIREYIDYFMANGPISFNPEHPLSIHMKKQDLFGGYAYDGIMAGSGVNAAFFKNKNKYVNEAWPKLFALEKSFLQNAISHEEAIQYLSENATSVITDWFKTEEETI